MLEDRDYMRAASGRLNWSATVLVLIANIVLFALQKTVLPERLLAYLVLSLEGLRHGFVWQLITFQLLHANVWHLLFNSLAIYFFGRSVEVVLGRYRWLTLYFLSGVVGGLLQMAFALLIPAYFDTPVVGASAGAAGLIGAFAVINWHERFTLLLYFVPLNMRGKTLFLVSVGLGVLGLVLGGAGVAHAAHLGGILTGVAWVKLGWHRDYLRLPWEGLLDRWRQRRPLRSRQRKRELLKAASVKRSKWPLPRAEKDADLPSEEFISREVDPILDKISEHGIQSLTERERRILEAARNKMAKR